MLEKETFEIFLRENVFVPLDAHIWLNSSFSSNCVVMCHPVFPVKRIMDVLFLLNLSGGEAEVKNQLFQLDRHLFFVLWGKEDRL